MKMQVTLTLFNKPITPTYHDPEFDPVLCASMANRLLGLNPDRDHPTVVIAELSNESFDGATVFHRQGAEFCHSPKFPWQFAMFKMSRKYLAQVRVMPNQSFYLKITLP